jgi:hypothetical protein
MVLTVSFVLFPVIGLVCHRHWWNRFRQFDASVEASEPHDFAVRKHAHSSVAPPASIASNPASVTIAIRPFEGWTAINMKVIWVRREQKYFCEEGWTEIAKQPVGQIREVAAIGAGRECRRVLLDPDCNFI